MLTICLHHLQSDSQSHLEYPLCFKSGKKKFYVVNNFLFIMTLIFKFEKQEWFDHILKSSVGDVSLCFSLHEIVVMIHCLSKQRILFLHLNRLQQLFCYIIVVFVPVFLEYVKT